MEPLVTPQRCLTWLCIHPAEETASVKRKKAYVALTVAALASQIFLVIACFAFCSKFHSTDIKRCMFSGMAVMTSLTAAYMLAIAVIQMRQKTADVFKDLTTIYETCESLKHLKHIRFCVN